MVCELGTDVWVGREVQRYEVLLENTQRPHVSGGKRGRRKWACGKALPLVAESIR